MTLIAAVALGTLAGSFLCSVMEASLYSISASRIESLRREGSAAGERLARLRADVEDPITAIISLNTMLNTLGSVFIGALVQRRFGDPALAVFSACFSASVLLFSEFLPHTLGVRFADRLAPRLSLPLTGLVAALGPLVRTAAALRRLTGGSVRIAHPTEEDVLSAALLSEAGGKLLPQEARWIRNVLRLNELRVADVMTPAGKMRRIPEALPLSMTKVDAGHWRFKRIPVCRDDRPDEIVGVVLRREVFRALLEMPPETTMGALMKPPLFVQESLPVHLLLQHLIEHHTQLALVRDHEGRLTGLVTLSDALRRLVGDSK